MMRPARSARSVRPLAGQRALPFPPLPALLPVPDAARVRRRRRTEERARAAAALFAWWRGR